MQSTIMSTPLYCTISKFLFSLSKHATLSSFYPIYCKDTQDIKCCFFCSSKKLYPIYMSSIICFAIHLNTCTCICQFNLCSAYSCTCIMHACTCIIITCTLHVGDLPCIHCMDMRLF